MPTLVKDPILNIEAVEAIIEKYNETSWLADARRAAFKSFESMPWPTNRDEIWRYTDIKRFAIDGLEASQAKTTDISERIQMRITDSDAEGIIVHKANQLIYRQAEISEEGVVFSDLRSAIKTHEELVKKHLFSIINTDTKYSALNAAFWENGSFVYVPKNVELSLPLGAFITADSGGFIAPRTLVVLDSNAKATFIDEYTSDDFEERLFTSGVVELIMADGANLEQERCSY